MSQISLNGTPKYFLDVYISGRITGFEDTAHDRFSDCFRIIVNRGYMPVNPITLPHAHDHQYFSYLREDIAALCKCDYIFFMPKWYLSRGSRIEWIIAKLLSIPRLYL